MPTSKVKKPRYLLDFVFYLKYFLYVKVSFNPNSYIARICALQSCLQVGCMILDRAIKSKAASVKTDDLPRPFNRILP